MVALWSKSCHANAVTWPAANPAALKRIGGTPLVSYKQAAGADLRAYFPLGVVRGYQAGGTITLEVWLHSTGNAGNHQFRANFAAIKPGEDMSVEPSVSGTAVDFAVTAIPAVANQAQRIRVTVPVNALDGFADGDAITVRLALLDGPSTVAAPILVREVSLYQEV